MNRNDFINKLYNYALNTQLKYNVPLLVTLAQAGIESADRNGAWGEGILAKNYNNYFGIKDSDQWDGEVITLNTPNDATPTSDFRVYATPGESFEDHALFLINNHRYSKAFNYTDPKDFSREIAAAGYAEIGYSSYYNMLSNTINNIINSDAYASILNNSQSQNAGIGAGLIGILIILGIIISKW